MICFAVYFLAAAKQWEAVLHAYLIFASLDAAVYLFLQSPAVATRGEEENDRRRSAWVTINKEKREKLSRLLIALALPLLLVFLTDYLLIVWNDTPY